MKKGLPLYDIILIGILVVLLAYYFVVQGPIKRQTEELEQQKANIQEQIAIVQPRIQEMKVWQDELTKINEKYDGNPTSIPDYPNIDPILNELSTFFDNGASYNIEHVSTSINGNVVTRVEVVSFTLGSYEAVKEKIDLINNSMFKYQITDLAISMNNGSCSCSLTFVAHEYSASGALD